MPGGVPIIGAGPQQVPVRVIHAVTEAMWTGVDGEPEYIVKVYLQMAGNPNVQIAMVSMDMEKYAELQKSIERRRKPGLQIEG